MIYFFCLFISTIHYLFYLHFCCAVMCIARPELFISLKRGAFIRCRCHCYSLYSNNDLTLAHTLSLNCKHIQNSETHRHFQTRIGRHILKPFAAVIMPAIAKFPTKQPSPNCKWSALTRATNAMSGVCNTINIHFQINFHGLRRYKLNARHLHDIHSL